MIFFPFYKYGRKKYFVIVLYWFHAVAPKAKIVFHGSKDIFDQFLNEIEANNCQVCFGCMSLSEKRYWFYWFELFWRTNFVKFSSLEYSSIYTVSRYDKLHITAKITTNFWQILTDRKNVYWNQLVFSHFILSKTVLTKMSFFDVIRESSHLLVKKRIFWNI